MKWPAAISFSIVSFTSLFYGIVPAKAPAPGWFSVGRSSLCVTEGVIKEAEGNRLSVDVPKMRAYVNQMDGAGHRGALHLSWPNSRAIAARFR